MRTYAAATKPKVMDYILWGSPVHALRCAREHVNNGAHEAIIFAAQSKLTHFSWIRNRIAHGQTDARNKFDTATWTLANARYRGQTAGMFLRDTDTTSIPHVSWIETMGATFKALAGSIV